MRKCHTYKQQVKQVCIVADLPEDEEAVCEPRDEEAVYEPEVGAIEDLLVSLVRI